MTRVSRRGRVTIAVLVVVFLLFTVLDRVIGAWADYLWFSEVKYPQVFTGVLETRLWMFLIFGVAVGLVLAGNLYLAYRTRSPTRPPASDQFVSSSSRTSSPVGHRKRGPIGIERS